MATDYVGPVQGSKIVYVIVGDRAKFDMIDLPEQDHLAQPHGHCLSKVVGNLTDRESVTVIFQHWIYTSSGG